MDALLVEILRQIKGLGDDFRDYKDRNDQRMRALLLTMQAERKDAAAHRALVQNQPARTVPPPAPEPAPAAPRPPADLSLSRALATLVAAGGWTAVVAVVILASPLLLATVAVVSWATSTPLLSIILALVGITDAISSAP